MSDSKKKHCDRDTNKDKTNDSFKPNDNNKGKGEPDSELHNEETFGTQRVYKKTSPNSVLTMYLPSREMTIMGGSSSIMRGIVFVDPKAIQGCGIYAQMTLTFRYGREDEEVMGLRFCNEAIMSLHQVWPRVELHSRESLTPLQDALIKRLGDGAYPFTLTLTPQAPPSVQLVPAKRYYGAPIGTSYDVRCFIADKTEEKFHRRASVKMGVRVVYRRDIRHTYGLGNSPADAKSIDTQNVPSPTPECLTTLPQAAYPPTNPSKLSNQSVQETGASNLSPSDIESRPTDANSPSSCSTKPQKSERIESFSKLRLSPKSFRFSSRFGRSKSEIEKSPNESYCNYSKSFHEYDNFCGGPQGSVDKPFLLQEGRVGLKASLDKAWYTHGEEVRVTVNIRNDSRKTVRKVRVCAIQHVDVCMFNNGKFKNVVADSDSNSVGDRNVLPGDTFDTIIVLKPQRGTTKNWIALEDTLQRTTEPEEITGAIAASAIRFPIVQSTSLHSSAHSISASRIQCNPQLSKQQIPEDQRHRHHAHPQQASVHNRNKQHGDDRNVFAIYVSYYVKVKLTLSGMGGELSIKLPFVLEHVGEEQRDMLPSHGVTRQWTLDDVPTKDQPNVINKTVRNRTFTDDIEEICSENISAQTNSLDIKETVHSEDLNRKLTEGNIKSIATTTAPTTTTTKSTTKSTLRTAIRMMNNKRQLKRSETLAREESDKDAINEVYHCSTAPTTASTTSSTCSASVQSIKSGAEVEAVHLVRIHNEQSEQQSDAEDATNSPKATFQNF